MTSNYPNRFLETVTIGGVPILQAHPGEVFWLNNSTVLAKKGRGGSDGNKGTYLSPFATLDFAVGKCTASRGDIIMVMPGHAETLSAADAVDLDVVGISVIGLGNGTNRATFTMDDAAGEITIGANNVTIENIIVNASVTAVLKGINVEAAVDNVTVRNCTFGVDIAGTDEFLHTISFENGSTDSLIEGCTIDMGIGGATAAIIADADTDKLVIQNNVIRGDYGTACIVGDTTLSTQIHIRNNTLVNGVGGNLNAQPGIELLTGTTGIISDNYIVCNLATKAASVVADTCLLFENYYNEDISGAATGGIIGAASADD